MGERHRQEPDTGLNLVWCGLGQDSDTVLRPRPHASPEAAVAREVVVARKQPPSAGMTLLGESACTIVRSSGPSVSKMSPATSTW